MIVDLRADISYDALAGGDRSISGRVLHWPHVRQKTLEQAQLEMAHACCVAAPRPPLFRSGQEESPERPILTIRQVFDLADAIEPRYRALVLLAVFVTARAAYIVGNERLVAPELSV